MCAVGSSNKNRVCRLDRTEKAYEESGCFRIMRSWVNVLSCENLIYLYKTGFGMAPQYAC